MVHRQIPQLGRGKEGRCQNVLVTKAVVTDDLYPISKTIGLHTETREAI